MAVKELGHIVLYVHNAERSAHFYRDILGWNAITEERPGMPVAAFSSGRTHHELLLIEVGEDATPPPRGRRAGLYHFGLKVGETDDELREVIKTLQANDVTIVGASDHTVTHSLYILDPDGNEIELYIDVQPEVWRDDPKAFLAPVKPLSL
jgi:catechol-2,3-dioxygenase